MSRLSTTQTQTCHIGIFWPRRSPIAVAGSSRGVYGRRSSLNVIWQLYLIASDVTLRRLQTWGRSYWPFCVVEKAGVRLEGFNVRALRRMEGVTGVSRVTTAVPEQTQRPAKS